MGEQEWVSVGRIGRAVGLKGECAVFWNSGQPPVEIGGEIFLTEPGKASYKSWRVAALRTQGRFDVVRLEGIEDRTAAEGLRNREVALPADRLPALPAGEYYCYQILGLRVVTEEGVELGRVERIFTAGEHDVYEVRGSGREVLIPAIEQVVLSIDLQQGVVTVRLMQGMLD